VGAFAIGRAVVDRRGISRLAPIGRSLEMTREGVRALTRDDMKEDTALVREGGGDSSLLTPDSR
jgi:hypothetical protein